MKTDSVRASRDGDQFHYFWAARQCLKLLGDTGLVGISIEGPSDSEAASPGDHLIDLAEYYGALDPRSASRIIYRQLKHSTDRPEQPWTLSGLAKTLRGFADKFHALDDSKDIAQFSFVSNRPVDSKVLQALEELQDPNPLVRTRLQAQILDCLNLDTAEAEDFCRHFSVDTRAPALLSLTSLFEQDVAGFLPGAPSDGPVRLKEQVVRRATSLESNTVVDLKVVLAALGAPSDGLLPAPTELDRPTTLVGVPRLSLLAEQLCETTSAAIVHAAGGVGKSVFASQLSAFLPPGSVSVVYDCFAHGKYRARSTARHEFAQGYVQIANELSAIGLCEPLVPGGTPTTRDWSIAFMHRLNRAALALQASAPEALLFVTVDAADNAVLAADEFGTETFVIDLLRENTPNNVRVVQLCRTERIQLLRPSPDVRIIPLGGFSVDDSRLVLEGHFGSKVTDANAAEFHRRTAGNGRIQAKILARSSSLMDCLIRLGQLAGSKEAATVNDLLSDLVKSFEFNNPNIDPRNIARLCTSLAVLRPRIPLKVLAALCDVDNSLIHSFAADLEGSVLVEGEALQFRDEPTETWFREHYLASEDVVESLTEGLMRLADSNSYAAISLPPLLWRLQKFDELVELALSGAALPSDSTLERHQLENARLQYALKAALNKGMHLASVRLALRAGSQGSGQSRRLGLLAENTDLSGLFLSNEAVEDLVASRELARDWPNSNLLREGTMMSFSKVARDSARSRLRSAIEWTTTWVNASSGKRTDHHVDAKDIAEIGMGLVNTESPGACIEFLSRWSPKSVALVPASIVASRLADQGRVDDLLALGSTSKPAIAIGVASVAWARGIVSTQELIAPVVEVVRQAGQIRDLQSGASASDGVDVQGAVFWIISQAFSHGLMTSAQASELMTKFLPERLSRDAGDRWGSSQTLTCIKGIALRAMILGQPVDLVDFAASAITEARAKSYVSSAESETFAANVEPLTPWINMWAVVTLDSSANLPGLASLMSGSMPDIHSDYRAPYMFVSCLARILADILATRASGNAATTQFANWLGRNYTYLSRLSLLDVIRTCARATHLHHLALTLAQQIVADIDSSREIWETRVEDLAALARAILPLSEDEAQEYFIRAIGSAERLGDEVRPRWQSMLAVSRAASKQTDIDDARAYRIAQIAEHMGEFAGDGFDYEEALQTIASLSPYQAVAVASRWRERRVGWIGASVRALSLSTDCVLSPVPLAAIAMTLMDRDPSPLKAARRAILLSPEQGQAVVDALTTFPSYMFDDVEAVRILEEAARQVDLVLDLTRFRRFPAATRAAPNSTYRSTTFTDNDWQAERQADLDAARARLAALDLDLVHDRQLARDLVRESALTRDDLLSAILRCPPILLAGRVAAIAEDQDFSEWDLASLIKIIQDTDVVSLSARHALRELATNLVARFCQSLTTRSYDIVDLDGLKTVTGFPGDYLGFALVELSRRAAPLSSDECFALASRVAARLTPAEAKVAFDEISEQFIEIAPFDSCDGNFEGMPSVPRDLESCVAAFVWAALGDPDMETRWKAAHVCSALISLGQHNIVHTMITFATGLAPPFPFVDSSLVFYAMHSKLWFLMALERSAHDENSDMSEIRPFLLETVNTTDHALIRESARNALLALGVDEVVPRDASPAPLELARLNRSIETFEQERGLSARHPRDAPQTSFKFFYDFADYWCRPLADLFGVPQASIERLTSEVITDDWRLPFRGESTDDERSKQRLYGENSVWPYKSSWPKEDDLDFYLSVHALQTVAGRLVETTPTYHEPWVSDGDPFASWLSRFRPTRGDGRWLADRRDPAPAPVLRLPEGNGLDANWPFSTNSGNFDQVLRAVPGWLTVAETSTERDYYHGQNIVVESALVDNHHGSALVAVLQPGSYSDFRLPEADDRDYDIDFAGFCLHGWIASHHGDTRLDSRDHFAADVNYPPPHPSDEIRERMALRSDRDMREWYSSDGVALRCSVWDDREESSQSVRGPSGARLEVNLSFLGAMLAEFNTSLLVSVMIDRTIDRELGKRSHMTEDEKSEFEYLDRSFRLFLIRAEDCG